MGFKFIINIIALLKQASNYWGIVGKLGICEKRSQRDNGTWQAMENMAMEKGYQHWPADIQVFSLF